MNDGTTMTWAAARDAIGAFFDALPEHPDRDEILTAYALDAERLGDAALSVFRHAYLCCLHSDLQRRDEDPGQWITRAAMMVGVDAKLRTRFVDTILFDVASTASYEELAARIYLILSPDDLISALVNVISDSAASNGRKANALNLPYYVFGRTSDPDLTEQQRRDLECAVDTLRAVPTEDLRLRAALASFSLPLHPVP